MRLIFRVFLALSSLAIIVNAATRGDVKIIEASENIRYLSQMIVKDYLFLYQNPKQVDIKVDLEIALESLSNNFRVIAVTSKDEDTKDILEFLAYSKDQIEEIFNEKPDSEMAALMLDYSETLLEGADSISSAYQYDFSDEEKMLMTTKQMNYLLQRVSKYYMAIQNKFDNTTNKKQMIIAMEDFQKNLDIMNLYDYSYDLKQDRNTINQYWKENKIYFSKSEKLYIPALIFASIDYLEEIIDKISLYHSKNQ